MIRLFEEATGSDETYFKFYFGLIRQNPYKNNKLLEVVHNHC